MTGYRRLDLKPAKKLRGQQRYMRMMRQDIAQLAQWFPERQNWTRDYDNVRMPVYEKLLSPQHTKDAVRIEALELLLKAGAAVAAQKPKEAPKSRIAILFEWPNLFYSEICAFFSADYAARFMPENYGVLAEKEPVQMGDEWVTTRPVKTDIFERLGLKVPKGFKAGGHILSSFDEIENQTFETERWSVMQAVAR